MAVSRINEAGLNVNQYGNRNLIINGAMRVAQRGTSFTGLGNGDTGYYLDRWRFQETGSPTYEFTLTQDTDAPDGFGYSQKWACTTAQSSLASNARIRTEYYFEGQDLQVLDKGSSSAKKVTLSFYIKSNLTGTLIANFEDQNTRQISKSFTIDSAATWERKTITFDGDTSGTIVNSNAKGLTLRIFFGAGTDYSSGTLATSWASVTNANQAAGIDINLASSTSNYVQFTGVQLEVGDTATDFEHRSYDDELSRCQRYFQAWGAIQAFASGVWFNSTQVLAHMPYIKEMRAAPTFTTSGNDFCKVYKSGGTIQVDDSTPFDIINTTSTRVNVGFGTAGTAGEGAMVQTETGAYIHVDAEL